MRITHYKVLAAILIFNISTFAHSNYDIEFKGIISEYTCSESSTSIECQNLNNAIAQVMTSISSLASAALNDNEIAELQVESIGLPNYAIVLTNYY